VAGIFLCRVDRVTGFCCAEDIGLERLAARFFPEAEGSAPARGGHIMHATTN
jgi:hypothetical protein